MKKKVSRLKHDKVSKNDIVPLRSEMVHEQSVSLVDLEQDGGPIDRGQSTKSEKLCNHESNDNCSSSSSSSNSSASMGWFFDNEKVEKKKDLKESECTIEKMCSPTSPTPKKSIEGIGKKVRTRLVEIKKNRREVRRIDTSTILAENLLLEKQSLSQRKGVSNEGDDRNNRKQGRGVLINPMIKKNAFRTKKGKRKRDVEKYHLEDDDKDTIVVDDWIPDTSHLPSVRSSTEDDNDKIDEELLREEFSNTVQLHGIPINTTSTHIRRLFTGLEPLKIVVLPTNPINLMELDSIHCFDKMEDIGHEHDQNPKLQRYASHTRIFVEFDSPSTTSLALQRSGEYIRITKETQKQAAKSSRMDDKTLGKSHKKQKDNPLKSNNDSHERTLTGHENGSITKSGLELLSDCLKDAAPSRTTKTFHVAVTVAPLCRKKYEVLAKNLFIPVDGPNNVPIIEVFLRQLEMKIDPIIPSILWTATIYELNITTPKVSSKKIARRPVQNQCDDDTELGQIEHSQSLNFALYGKFNTYRIGRNMMKTNEEYDQLEQHCVYIQETVKCIQGKNPYVILIGLDPTIGHKDPIACLTARAIQCLKKAQDVIRQILLIAKRLHCQYFDNDRKRMKSLFRTFRFVRADVPTMTDRSVDTNLEM